MVKNKIFYRIQNIETKRYYAGKATYVANPNYDSNYDSKYNYWNPQDCLSIEQINQYKKFYSLDRNNVYREIHYYNKELDFDASELPPWIKHKSCYWSDEGKMYDTRKGAELVLSGLTKTSKKLRANKVDFLLNAPPKAAKYKLTACKLEIVEVQLEDEKV